MDGVEASDGAVAALGPLRPLVVEGQGQRHDLALLHQPRRRHDVLGHRVVEGPDLVRGPPFPPVLEPLRRGADVVHGQPAQGPVGFRHAGSPRRFGGWMPQAAPAAPQAVIGAGPPPLLAPLHFGQAAEVPTRRRTRRKYPNAAEECNALRAPRRATVEPNQATRLAPACGVALSENGGIAAPDPPRFTGTVEKGRGGKTRSPLTRLECPCILPRYAVGRATVGRFARPAHRGCARTPPATSIGASGSACPPSTTGVFGESMRP